MGGRNGLCVQLVVGVNSPNRPNNSTTGLPAPPDSVKVATVTNGVKSEIQFVLVEPTERADEANGWMHLAVSTMLVGEVSRFTQQGMETQVRLLELHKQKDVSPNDEVPGGAWLVHGWWCIPGAWLVVHRWCMVGGA